MRFFNIFFYEFYHFRKNNSKVVTYLIFLFACVYAIITGFNLQDKQLQTISHIENEQKNELNKVFNWFDNEMSGPKGKNWIDIKTDHLPWVEEFNKITSRKEISKLEKFLLNEANKEFVN